MPVIFPIAYFGSIGWFRELIRQKEVCFEAWDHFPKQTFRNRCTIVSPEGFTRLTVPVEKPNGNKTLTKDILISSHQNWQKDHWRAIQSAYASAPYFDHYAGDVEKIIFEDHENLLALTLTTTEFCLQQFGIEISYSLTKDYLPQAPDFRSCDFEKIQGANYKYRQVLFKSDRFLANASILDLLFCEGPLGRKILADN